MEDNKLFTDKQIVVLATAIACANKGIHATPQIYDFFYKALIPKKKMKAKKKGDKK